MSTPVSAPGTTAELAGLLAHELNNIAVPMQGFTDLASSDVDGAGEALTRCLDEVRIGIGRIAAMSRRLERLAQPAGQPRPIAVRDGMAVDAGPEVQFDCDPTLLIAVDPPRLHDAVDALCDVSGEGATLAVTRGVDVADCCAACGTPLIPATAWLRVSLRAARLPGIDAIRAPFSAGHAMRSSRRLDLAAWVHSSHAANGHVLATPSESALCIVLPLAAG